MAGTAVLRRLKWRTARVLDLHDETATARTIRLAVRDWPGHIAGQHVDVRLTAPDGYTAVRSYSIASTPNPDGPIEITVERLPNGEVSPYLTMELMVGDELELRGPIGGWFVWRNLEPGWFIMKPIGGPVVKDGQVRAFKTARRAMQAADSIIRIPKKRRSLHERLLRIPS